jgi:phosphodiesterase/alkaline phosphatase D-like protein
MRIGPNRLHQIMLVTIDPAGFGGLDHRLNLPPHSPGDWCFPHPVRATRRTGHSVILQTCVFDHERGSIPHPLIVQVARSWRFNQLVAEADVMATREDNFRIRLRLERLEPNHRYYFRFVYLGIDGIAYVSPTGFIAPGGKSEGLHSFHQSHELLIKSSSID